MNNTCCAPKTEHRSTGEEYTRTGAHYQPMVDIVERADELLLLADMPGVSADSIDVHFEDGQLTIHGSVKERLPEQANLLQHEYGVGDFHRTFRVGQRIDASKINAEYSAGVLTVHLPKIEAIKPRKIVVQTAG
jgi:HSP20 family protein